jgi:hypothetical protein
MAGARKNENPNAPLMQSEPVSPAPTPCSYLDPATEVRLLADMLEVEKMIDELEGVIDLETIFSNSKELSWAGCAGKPNLREDPQLPQLP